MCALARRTVVCAISTSLRASNLLGVSAGDRSVLAFGFVGTVIIFVSYNEFLDCSIPETHESANTPLGWSTAAVATGVPLLVGVVLGLRQSRRIVGTAVLVALVEAVVWVWALNPGGCEGALAAVGVQIAR